MDENCNVKNLYNLVISNLRTFVRMDDYEIGTKLICVGTDGASVMQGNRNDLCVRLQNFVAPYMIPIHCMTYRMNFAYRIVSTFISV